MIRKTIVTIVASSLLCLSIGALSAEYASAQRKVPKKARNLKKDGDKQFNRGQLERAIAKYAEAISRADHYADARFWKGYSHWKLYEQRNRTGGDTAGQLDLALMELDAAERFGHPPVDVHSVRWYVHYLKGNNDEALADVRAGLRLKPGDLTLQAGLADILYNKRMYADAVEAYVAVADRIPNNGNVYFNIANAHFNLGNTADQLAASEKAISGRTKYIAESYFLMGDAYHKQRNLDSAIDAFERSMSASDRIKATYHSLADIYHSKNMYEEAIETLKKGLQVYPTDGALYVDLSWYQSLADKHAEAVGSAQRAAALVPENYMAHTNLCRGYNDLRQFAKAIEACEEALRINPGDGETNFYLGRSYAGLGQQAKAKDYYKKSVAGLLEYSRLRPYYADAYYLLGNAYYENDLIGDAIGAYKKSLELSPKFTKAIYNLGVAYLVSKQSDKRDRVKEQYAKLVDLDPNEAEKLKSVAGQLGVSLR